MLVQLIRVAFLGVLVGQLACSQSTEYSGDGRLVDNGLFAPTDRYLLYLDEISLSEAYTSTYNMKNLPVENFTIGLQVAPGTASIRQSLQGVVVSVRLVEGEKTFFEYERQLQDWTWAVPAHEEWAFAYIGDGVGTRFEPGKGLDYQLTISVKPKEGLGPDKRLILLAKGGGWK